MSHPVNGHCARISLVLSTDATSEIGRHCPRCKVDRAFASSGRFRVNAQKKLIDIWLIWRCTACDQTWNHAIYERRAVRSLPAAELQAFMRNDAVLAWHHAGRLAAQSAWGSPAADIRIERHVLVPVTERAERLEIIIAAQFRNAPRLDRVLAAGLRLGRPEIAELAGSGLLVVAGAGIRALRRPAVDGQEMSIDLLRCPERIVAGCRNL